MTPPPPYRLHVVPWLRRPGGRLLVQDWLAITIGADVWAWRRLSGPELAHELCHVRQWDVYGWLFVSRYTRASWRAWRGGRHPYRDNAFEVEARAAAEKVAAAEAAGRIGAELSSSGGGPPP